MSASLKLFCLLALFVALPMLVCSQGEPGASVPEGTVEAGMPGSAADATTLEQEEKASPEGFSVKDKKLLEKAMEGAQKYEFQAEVSRMLSIIINSLYTNKEIFLRELISNASDALDKIRFLSLTEPDVLKSGAELEIKIIPDKVNNVLRIRDTGIGMTKDDLINNLGTIAKSGTRSFLEKMRESADLNLIGQFGVGFYSIFLVADDVSVITKHNDDVQLVWESTADNTFSITEDPRGNTLNRGTEIVLTLKEDAKEFLEESRLRDLIKKYSEFIHFPIYLYTTKEVEKEVPVATPEKTETETPETESDEDVDVSDEDETEEAPEQKTEKVKEIVNEFEKVNENKPLWQRSPKDVEDEEYNSFYKSLTKEYDDPLSHIHFTAEGDVEFRSILFVPGHAPHNMFENYGGKTTNIKLYVRRVFITDEFNDLLPRYLNFIRGLVDSEDLPLNVSREILQQSRILKVIRKKLIRKAIEMFQNISDNDKKEAEKAAEEGKEAPEKNYTKFWNEFGKNIRLGVIEDSANKAKLASLLRYESTTSNGTLTSLDEYIERAGEKQKYIYYIAGESKEAVENSPFLEELKKRDLEVLYLVDALDEYTVQNLEDYEGKKLMSVTKEGLKFSEESEEEKAEEKEAKKEYEPLTKFLKDMLSDSIEKAVVSKRLASTPCILVASEYGPSANMERIMKAQALGGKETRVPKSRKVLEINPNHPIIADLKERVDEDPESETTKDLARLLYDTAVLQSGYTVDNTAAFAERIHRLVKIGFSTHEKEVKVEETTSSTKTEAPRDFKDEL